MKRKSLICKGTLKTDLDVTQILDEKPHCHGGDQSLVDACKTRQAMLSRSQNCRDTPAQIYSSCVLQAPQSAQKVLPKESNCKQAIGYHRRKRYPKTPASLKDLVIEDEWKTTGSLEPQPFLIYDNGPDTPSRILVFGSEDVIVDFELPVINAVKFVLGVDPSGCFYHKRQCTWRRLQSEGLVSHYRPNEDFRLFCGMVDGLAFLPPLDVSKGLQFLKEICPPEGEELLSYVDVTYVNGPFKQTKTGDMTFRMRRVPPPFPPSVWTVHSATLLDCARRNNLCKGWNTRFQHLVGHHHPTIWKR